MALEEAANSPALIAESVLNTSSDVATDIAVGLGSIGKWLQAIGIIVILWLIFNIINWALNRKRVKRLDSMRSDLERIEKKLDKVLKRKTN
ncbi:MAG: hypothetical protein KJ718_02805 [Nanoarchaeota archaeon]|nr:hypothetical protein [Nanoarchaeota archaeon]MBU1051459.1 hypothetical protein [Nanoarchaeota archaeon]